MVRNAGSSDYRNTTGVMRATFVKVVNDDVSPVLRDVVCPVLLVWGENDDAVPLWMGQKMEKEMKNCFLFLKIYQTETTKDLRNYLNHSLQVSMHYLYLD